MTNTIWKFIPEITDSIHIEMPDGARIIHAEAHGDRQLQVWAEVNTDTPYTKTRELRVYGTGHPMPDNPGRHIATTFSGPFVWHVYDPQGEAFDRWIAAHDAEVAAKAWDEGLAVGDTYGADAVSLNPMHANPYRHEERT